MKRMIGVGLLFVWIGGSELPAQESNSAPEAKNTNVSAVVPTAAVDVKATAKTTPEEAEEGAEAATNQTALAPSTNEVFPAHTVPEELRTNIIARFPFDDSERSDHTMGLSVPVMFKRQSSAYAEGQPVELNTPALAKGKFGKGLLLEEAHANFLSLAQSGAEGDTSGEYTPLKDTKLSFTTSAHWEGKQALKVETTGEAGAEGLAIEATMETALYNGSAIVPACYVFSVYLRGTGNLMLSLKDPGSETTPEPVYIELTTNDWKRYSCTYACPVTAKNIGPKHENDWKSLFPTNSTLQVKLQFTCATMDKQKVIFFADGFQLEPRLLPFAAQGTGLSPHSWTPGKTTVAQDEFSFSIKDKAFTSWKQSGSISFWFKPGWDARDGTQELMLYMGPEALHLRHASGKIRFYPAGRDFTPYDWKDNWHHIAVTWTMEGDRVLYVDGYDYTNTNGEQKPLPPTTDFLAFSYLGNGYSPNGVIDELIIFNGVLNLDQIKVIASYDPLNPPKPKPPEEPSAESKPAEPPATTNAPAATTPEASKTTEVQPTNASAAAASEAQTAEAPAPAQAAPATPAPAVSNPAPASSGEAI